MKLEEFCTVFAGALAAQATVEAKLETGSRLLGQVFSVKPDEIAIFRLDPADGTLSFLWPVHLRKSGSIPLSMLNSLVAQTARENRGFFNNSFAATPHASVFEQFKPLGDSKPLSIQKILSVPMGVGKEIRGVVQVSRKGEHPGAAGRDFTHNDVVILQKAAEILAQAGE